MALAAGKGHVPPAFSWVEIGVALFHGGIVRHRPDQPRWPERDRFLLSKGHGCLTLYGLLADRGYFPREALDTFAADGSMLPGHPDPAIPGVEVVSGSLGHGLGVGAGLALGARRDGADWKVFVVLGDGECQEGSVYEAMLFAAQHALGNLVAIIDRNGLGSTDFTENVLRLEPLALRWGALGWEVYEVDGHSLPDLVRSLTDARNHPGDRPRVVICRTTKGRGVSFMEGSPAWHHRMPRGEEIERARRELAAAPDAPEVAP
jgi:transketolase